MDLIAMPQLGETVTEGTIISWSKQVGDLVEPDDPLFEVSTEKVDTEVPSALRGYLRQILVAEGSTVPIGTPVAILTATADEDLEPEAVALAGASEAGGAADGIEPGAVPISAAPSPSATVAHLRAASDGETGGGVLSPIVRRLLQESGLQPAAVTGSGRDGRITRADVLAAVAQRAGRSGGGNHHDPAPAAVRPSVPARVEVAEDDLVVDLSRARLATAEHMAKSLATSAHALVVVEVDYSAVDVVRRAAGLSYLPFVARAVIDAIREFPHVNASFDVDRLVVHRSVNLGVAVDVDREALVVPVVHRADELRLPALAAAVGDLAERARRRRLAGEALGGGTFTITNVGSFGTVVTAPIINQPQVAILSTDGVRMAPVAIRTDDASSPTAKEWGIAVHPIGNLCLSFDHRAFDGAYAAAFLARIRDLLQTRDWTAEVAP